MRNPELWARLQAHAFDRGRGSAPFSVKLARAQGWSATFTARVIEEYRRFLYLTQVSDRQVTPSVTVDAVWHMHLTFTRDYWEDLCPNVIGAKVHHQPCAGEEEMPRYREQFEVTKALYREEFGQEPPVAIWGGGNVQSARTLMVSEAGSLTTSPTFIAFVPFAICLVLLLIEPDLIIFALTVLTGIMFVVVLMNPRRRRRRDRRGDEQDWIEIETDNDTETGRGGSSSSARGTKSSRSDDVDRSSGGSRGGGGIFGFFSGDGDGDSGGGCGGCGGGD